ncbi:MAG TPA: hypothetical protein PK808_13080 [Polymorphobacter sp.]|nr:hypothetical protein [Polymorphobacter sp.]
MRWHGVTSVAVGLAIWAALAAADTAPPAKSPFAVPDPPRRIVFQNRYYAKPGKEDEVYQWRLHASDVRVQLGLRRGQVYRGAGGDQPDAVWQLELSPEEAVAEQKRGKEVSAQFDPVADHMSTLLRHFERRRYVEIMHYDEPAAAPKP